MATIWRGGCIIRARFLDRIREAYQADAGLRNLLFAGYFRDAVGQAQDAWRRVVATAAELDVVTDTVERLAGHPPTTLGDYVRGHPESLDHVRG